MLILALSAISLIAVFLLSFWLFVWFERGRGRRVPLRRRIQITLLGAGALVVASLPVVLRFGMTGITICLATVPLAGIGALWWAARWPAGGTAQSTPAQRKQQIALLLVQFFVLLSLASRNHIVLWGLCVGAWVLSVVWWSELAHAARKGAKRMSGTSSPPDQLGRGRDA